MKAHLIDSDAPLLEGETYTALCGDDVPRCVFVYMFNTDEAEEFLSALSTINTCRKCFQIEIEKRYVYGIVPGAEVRPAHEAELAEVAA